MRTSPTMARKIGHVRSVILSTTAYWLLVSLIPIVNKRFFRKSAYPYPVATAGIQLGLVGVALSLLCCAIHHVEERGRAREVELAGEGVFRSPSVRVGRKTMGDDCEFFAKGEAGDAERIEQLNNRARRWIFDEHLLWKLRTVLPVGALFGLKYAVTNQGLMMVSTPVHLLLQSTDLVWTMLWAYLINGERIDYVGLTSLLGCVAGTVMLSTQVVSNNGKEVPKRYRDVAVLAILMNLLSPILLGLCIATLRSACVELRRKTNRVGGRVSSVEITALKLLVSSPVALVLATMFEGHWLQAFRDLSLPTRLGVMGSSLPILAYQVNCTYLIAITSAVSVGLVGQLKIIPQWIAAVLFSTPTGGQGYLLAGWNAAGTAVTIVSASGYAVHNWVTYNEDHQTSRRERSNATGSTSAESNPNEAASRSSGRVDYGIDPETSRLIESRVDRSRRKSDGGYRTFLMR